MSKTTKTSKNKQVRKKKSLKEAWKILDKLKFHGPKTNCVDEIDRLQGVI